MLLMDKIFISGGLVCVKKNLHPVISYWLGNKSFKLFFLRILALEWQYYTTITILFTTWINNIISGYIAIEFAHTKKMHNHEVLFNFTIKHSVSECSWKAVYWFKNAYNVKVLTFLFNGFYLMYTHRYHYDTLLHNCYKLCLIKAKKNFYFVL